VQANLTAFAMPAVQEDFTKEYKETYTSIEAEHDGTYVPDEENDDMYDFENNKDEEHDSEEDEEDEEEEYEYDYYGEKAVGAFVVPNAAYESIMPLVSDWPELAQAVADAIPGVPMTIELLHDIPDEGHSAIVDVSGDDWFAIYVGFAQQNALLKGYPSGSFEPHWNMTRAEFTAMMARFSGLAPYGASAFPDVGDHWASGYINILTTSVPGAIIGYEDGTFRPDAFITRAEAVKIVNYVLNRGVDAEGLEGVQYRSFPDIVGHWAYFEIIEASNTHTFVPTAYGERWQSARWNIWWR